MEMRKKSINRREFIRGAAITSGLAGLAARPAAARPRAMPGANDRVGVGFIGIGIRGTLLMEATQKVAGTQVAACADLYDGHFERARELGASSALMTRDYLKVLDHKDVDAVIIATPDHWHKKMVLDSLAAGKDVYIEKPMTHRWEDGAEFEAAVKKSGRILQVGSQQQSNPANSKVRELIRSGALGQITFISGAIHRNTATGAWYYPIPPDASEKTIDWKRFIGDTKGYDFDPKRFFQWRLYWEYSGGLATDLFVHLVTATHYLMDATMPKRVTTVGDIFRWKERREVPDHVSALAEYAEGFILSLTSTANNNHPYPSLTIMGTEGTLDYYGNRCVYYPEPVRESYAYSTHSWPLKTQEAFARANHVDPKTMRPLDSPAPGEKQEFQFQGDSTLLHLEAFFESVRARKQPVEDVVFGAHAAGVGHMVNLSYRRQKPVTWDAARRAVVV